ncbi:MAG: alpha/beta fold hydrolase [Acidimicrobiia bacterium]
MTAVDERRPPRGGARAPVPNIPRGRRIELYRRGTTFVRTVKGPPGAPTVVLLHGLAATAALNWHQAFKPLSEHFRVIAPDMRGHGRGIRSPRRFRLADCATDVAETLRALDADPAIAVGYSMGGPVAQLLWRDHPDVVSGLVLCATGTEFVPGNRERYAIVALTEILASTTRLGSWLGWLPGGVARRVLNVPTGASGTPMAAWARKEMSKHSPRLLLEAGQSVATYSSKDWLHRVDVPTSVLVTTRDSAVMPVAQFRMATAIPNSHVNLIDDGHLACVYPEFGHKLADACLDVQRRVEQRALGLWPVPT